MSSEVAAVPVLSSTAPGGEPQTVPAEGGDAAGKGQAVTAAAPAAAGASSSSSSNGEWSVTSNIQVVVRVRPLNEKEKRISEPIVSVHEEKVVLVKDPGHFADNYMRKARLRDRKYAFDVCCDPDSTNAQVYERTARNLIDNVLQGQNASVFSYGATNSGKTYTLFGTPEQPGIIFHALRELYLKIEGMRASGQWEVKCTVSMIEIYNENIRDLTVDPSSYADDTVPWLDLREDPIKGPCVAGVAEHEVEGAADVMNLLIEGNKRRTQEPTAANKESSRSHAVLQILIQTKEKFSTHYNVGKFSLIDLAGSERAANTQNRGIRLLEGANINRSLLALGNCITALVQGKGSFVPYRDSKLTRLLKDSLGGATKTIMICCVSPAATSFEESLNTLKYADRAKRIRLPALARNVQTVNYQLSEYESLISGLRGEVNTLKARLASLGGAALSPGGTHPLLGSPSERANGGNGGAAGGAAGSSLFTSGGTLNTAALFPSGHGGPGGADSFASLMMMMSGALSPGGFPVSSSVASGAAAGAANGSTSTPIRGAASLAAAAAAEGNKSLTPTTAAQMMMQAAALDAETAERMRQLRSALVANFQDRMQLRRSLAELQAKNVENTVEIAKRQMTLARYGLPTEFTTAELAGENLPAVLPNGDSEPSDFAAVGAARKEIVEMQHSIALNGKIKADIVERLKENETQGASLRDELDRYGTTEDRKELLAMEYRVLLLELEKVEQQQTQLLFEKMMAQREVQLRKMKAQQKKKDALISAMRDALEKRGLLDSLDPSLLVALDNYQNGSANAATIATTASGSSAESGESPTSSSFAQFGSGSGPGAMPRGGSKASGSSSKGGDAATAAANKKLSNQLLAALAGAANSLVADGLEDDDDNEDGDDEEDGGSGASWAMPAALASPPPVPAPGNSNKQQASSPKGQAPAASSAIPSSSPITASPKTSNNNNGTAPAGSSPSSASASTSVDASATSSVSASSSASATAMAGPGAAMMNMMLEQQQQQQHQQAPAQAPAAMMTVSNGVVIGAKPQPSSSSSSSSSSGSSSSLGQYGQSTLVGPSPAMMMAGMPMMAPAMAGMQMQMQMMQPMMQMQQQMQMAQMQQMTPQQQQQMAAAAAMMQMQQMAAMMQQQQQMQQHTASSPGGRGYVLGAPPQPPAIPGRGGPSSNTANASGNNVGGLNNRTVAAYARGPANVGGGNNNNSGNSGTGPTRRPAAGQGNGSAAMKRSHSNTSSNNNNSASVYGAPVLGSGRGSSNSSGHSNGNATSSLSAMLESTAAAATAAAALAQQQQQLQQNRLARGGAGLVAAAPVHSSRSDTSLGGGAGSALSARLLAGLDSGSSLTTGVSSSMLAAVVSGRGGLVGPSGSVDLGALSRTGGGANQNSARGAAGAQGGGRGAGLGVSSSVYGTSSTGAANAYAGGVGTLGAAAAAGRRRRKPGAGPSAETASLLSALGLPPSGGLVAAPVNNAGSSIPVPVAGRRAGKAAGPSSLSGGNSVFESPSADLSAMPSTLSAGPSFVENNSSQAGGSSLSIGIKPRAPANGQPGPRGRVRNPLQAASPVGSPYGKRVGAGGAGGSMPASGSNASGSPRASVVASGSTGRPSLVTYSSSSVGVGGGTSPVLVATAAATASGGASPTAATIQSQTSGGAHSRMPRVSPIRAPSDDSSSGSSSNVLTAVAVPALVAPVPAPAEVAAASVVEVAAPVALAAEAAPLVAAT